MEFKNFYHNYAGKMFWALSSLGWGAITWFLAWGPGTQLPITYEMRIILCLICLAWYFHKTLNYKQQTIQLTFFEYPFSIPGWKWLCVPAIVLLLIESYAKGVVYEDTILRQMAFIVFAGPFLEEMFAHFVFIKYQMSTLQFIFFNTLSAIAFTIMHASYSVPAPSLYDLFFVVGHFHYGFMLGILAYRSQRIELPIVVHMITNLLNHTLPVVILKHPLHPIIDLTVTCISYLLLAGVTGKQKMIVPDNQDTKQSIT